MKVNGNILLGLHSCNFTKKYDGESNKLEGFRRLYVHLFLRDQLYNLSFKQIKD